MRVERNYSQKEIAAELGVTVQTLRNYEIDTGKMPASKYFKLLGILDRTITEGQEDYIVRVVKDRLQDVLEYPEGYGEFEVEVGKIELKRKKIKVFFQYQYFVSKSFFRGTVLTENIAEVNHIFCQEIDPVHGDVSNEFYLPDRCCKILNKELNLFL